MTAAAEILAQASARGVRIWREAERLRYAGPGQALQPAFLAVLRQNKRTLLEALAEPASMPAKVDTAPPAAPVAESPDPQGKPFWAVFGLGGPAACWRITDPGGRQHISVFWPEARESDVLRSYPGYKVEQLFTEEERAALIARASPAAACSEERP